MKKIIVIFFIMLASLFAKVDINSADVKTLSTIDGIGIKKAQSIVEYRDKNGKFKDINGLLKVKGIGLKVFESIKDQVEAK